MAQRRAYRRSTKVVFERETSLYLRRLVNAPTPPAAIATEIAVAAVEAPRIPMAAPPEIPAATPVMGMAPPPVPAVATAEAATIPIAPITRAQATLPVARILMVFRARSPSISISSSLDLRASPSSFSVFTLRAIINILNELNFQSKFYVLIIAANDWPHSIVELPLLLASFSYEFLTPIIPYFSSKRFIMKWPLAIS